MEKVLDQFKEVKAEEKSEEDLIKEMTGDADDNGIVELLPGTTSEEMKAMYFDSDALVEPSYRVYQLNSNGERFYYTIGENGEPTFYPSVTTILSKTMPMSPYLLDWMFSKGKEEAERYKNERAAYGTFMHISFEELIINRTYDLDGLKGRLKAYIEEKRLPDDFIFYADDLKKDILAFAQFVKDYKVKPLAIEISLVSKKGYAGSVDMPCRMAEKKDSDTMINAIVDFKSGRNGFYEAHEIQLHMYKDMWNENFPDLQIDRVFNFSPKNWRKNPSYNLKDQTDCKSQYKIPSLLAIANIDNDDRPDFIHASGIVNLDDDDFSDNIITLSMSELVKSKHDEIKHPDVEEESQETPIEDENIVSNEQSKESSIVESETKDNALNAEFGSLFKEEDF